MIRKWFFRKARERRSRILWLVGLVVTVVENVILVFITVLLVWAFQSRTMPALNIWHTTPLTAEFTSDDATPDRTLQDYLDQEERLFDELQAEIYDPAPAGAQFDYCRYRAGGPQDPARLPRNWNRTFELVPADIRGGALLLHGLSDSPYSLRRIGELLHAQGFYVLGLRLPGHGTIPGALTRVHWEDWVAASRIAGRHVRQRTGPGKPFVIVGYSNGGALAVKYGLDALSDPSLPPADRLLLFSPEIGITPFSAIANAHKLFSYIPYFEQSKWLSIQPEYDPFKYNSFPKNAGQQAHEITSALQVQLQSAQSAGMLTGFPPVLTFLSWVDATVDTDRTIDRLYGQLENPGNELVIFDVDRNDQAMAFYPAGDAGRLEALERRADLPYRLTIIANRTPQASALAQRTTAPRSGDTQVAPLDMAWPRGVYSLSHVAVPFAPDDPVYGANGAASRVYTGLPLGNMQPRGETGYLTVPVRQLMRLRYNPFFSYVEQRVVAGIDEVLKQSSTSVP